MVGEEGYAGDQREACAVTFQLQDCDSRCSMFSDIQSAGELPEDMGFEAQCDTRRYLVWSVDNLIQGTLITCSNIPPLDPSRWANNVWAQV